jgi:phage terminase large subunit-like protein
MILAPNDPANPYHVRVAYLELLEEQVRRLTRRKFWTYYPEEGPLRRELYPKHMAFFAAGSKFRQRLMLAANRVGKTESVGVYELVCHLTGIYPEWWDAIGGRRFNRPIVAWAAGDTGKTVRDILQFKLLGPWGNFGTGVLPGDTLKSTTSKQGVSEAIEGVTVRHVSGGTSQVLLKSYDQKREAFQGTEVDVILLDEEPPLDIYTECLLRTMTNNGMLMLTFTPLMGMSDVVLAFLPSGKLDEGAAEGKFVVMATWDDVPHLSPQVKAELLASIPPFQRDARSKGVPQLGAGAIYPIPESDIIIPDFALPAHWPRAYGLDVGWNRTAAVWGAIDREAETVYLYSEHYKGQAEPVVHKTSIDARGKWIPGVIDPASRGRGQKDGEQLLQAYKDLGLDVSEADNGVEAGLLRVWERMSGGKLKVFKSMQNWLAEYRMYRRDDKGHVVKANDHLMDATRYLVVSGLDRAIVQPIALHQVQTEAPQSFFGIDL